MASIQIHYDGDIIKNHRISMRTLGRTLFHLQNSMDRAFIDIKFGQLWKHSRLPSKYYSEIELIVQDPKEGGFILDFISQNDITKKVINKVSNAVNEAINLSKEESIRNTDSIEDRIRNRGASGFTMGKQ
jgi:hypothetical protein